MILHLFRRAPRAHTIASLYGAIVAQARNPAFYQRYSVPDTVNGRFEMLLLHAALVLSRLEADAAGRRLGQGIFDQFCTDMDGHLREMGVGDLAVPRRMRAIGEAFYGRKQAYETALAATGLEELTAVLARNVYAGAANAAEMGASQLACYVSEAMRALAAQDAATFQRGSADFPDPVSLASAPPRLATATGAP